jgi:hypothetical protein
VSANFIARIMFLWFAEMARMSMRFDHIANRIVNADHNQSLIGCNAVRSRLHSRRRLARHTTADRMAAYRR